MIRDNDPCDDVGRNGWQAWCGHRETIPTVMQQFLDTRLGSTMTPDYASYGRRLDPAPMADDAIVPPVKDDGEPDRSNWRNGRELPPDLKIGDRLPMPSRKLDIRPSFVDKLHHPRGAFNRGRKQTI